MRAYKKNAYIHVIIRKVQDLRNEYKYCLWFLLLDYKNQCISTREAYEHYSCCCCCAVVLSQHLICR